MVKIVAPQFETIREIVKLIVAYADWSNKKLHCAWLSVVLRLRIKGTRLLIRPIDAVKTQSLLVLSAASFRIGKLQRMHFVCGLRKKPKIIPYCFCLGMGFWIMSAKNRKEKKEDMTWIVELREADSKWMSLSIQAWHIIILVIQFCFLLFVIMLVLKIISIVYSKFQKFKNRKSLKIQMEFENEASVNEISEDIRFIKQ